jgi:Mg2+ and Co2+ transporter CorA
MSLLVDWLTDQYLNLRTSFTQQLEYWQQQLLNPNGHFSDWTELLKASSRLRHYRLLTVEPQEEVLDHWIDKTTIPVDPRTEVRLNDIVGHFERVRRDAEAIQSDLDNLTQIYFSATNQRTNEIMRVLTIVSVIFLPLNLLAGIYGMNFAHIPGANTPGGFFLILGLMLAIAAGILWFLRWRNWL